MWAMWHKGLNSLLQLVGLKYSLTNVAYTCRWDKMKSLLVKTGRSNGVYFKITWQRIKRSYVITSFLLLSLSETPNIKHQKLYFICISESLNCYLSVSPIQKYYNDLSYLRILVSSYIPRRHVSYNFRHKNVLFACKRQGYVITYLKSFSNYFLLEQNAIKGELKKNNTFL